MLPPLLPIIPKLPAVPKPQRQSAVSVGEGFVQVLFDKPDDAGARVLMLSDGVPFVAGSLLPERGILTITITPAGKYRYCWRA